LRIGPFLELILGSYAESITIPTKPSFTCNK
jgi:hypothetical protein